MSHIDIMLKTLLDEMILYPVRDNVLPKYQIVLQKIRDILGKIRECQNEQSSEMYFDQLQEIHSPLSILVFKENIDEHPSINKFVSDFDRVDDPRLRKYMFNAIKNDNYTI